MPRYWLNPSLTLPLSRGGEKSCSLPFARGGRVGRSREGGIGRSRLRPYCLLPTAYCLFLIAYGLLTSHLVLAQPATPSVNREIAAVRVTQPPKIDGKLDDECWKSLPRASGFWDETLNTPVQDDTIVWLGYDSTHLYVAFHCKDAQPQGIIARETKRGARLRGDDQFRFRFNPFNSRREEDTSELRVNPLGTQLASFAGGRADKQEWEGVWQSSCHVVEDGWQGEMAIPWRLFVRPNTTGKPTNLGVNFERVQARTQIRSYWSNLGVQERLEFDGAWVGVVMPPVEKTNPLSLLTYLTGGYEANQIGGRAGLDARYQFTPSLTGLMALNPDFANVEGDVTSIDFSYSERLAEERRPFFQEGSGFYSTFSLPVRPFESVRIPQFDLGTKFYGRLGKGTNVGLLSTWSFRGRNDLVANVRHQFSPFDQVGLQMVRLNQAGNNNTVLYGNTFLRRGDWNFFAGWGFSRDIAGDGDTGGLSLNWNSKRWFANASTSYVSPKFQARNGYVPFQDTQGVNVGGGYEAEWRTGPFRSFFWSTDFYEYRHTNDTPFRGGMETSLFLQTASQWNLSLGYSAGHFEENRDHTYSVTVSYPARNRYQNFSLGYVGGRQDGAAYTSLDAGINWRFFNRLTLSLFSELVQLRGTEQQHLFTLAYDITPEFGIGGRLVRRQGKTNGYLSLRKSGYGGTEYFLILGDPNAEQFTSRVIFKVIHPL